MVVLGIVPCSAFSQVDQQTITSKPWPGMCLLFTNSCKITICLINYEFHFQIIYVTRNPKDTIVSMHNFVRSTPSMAFNGTLEETFESFANNRCHYSPWFDHFSTFWAMRNHHKNIFFVTFERILKVNGFLIVIVQQKSPTSSFTGF